MAMRSEATIERDHYFNRRYLKRERMVSFIEQIELVKRFAPEGATILEVGRGNGFVDGFLRTYLDYPVTTVDINADLEPDIVDDITNPARLQPDSYDVVTCFEVLEHMPFEQACAAVATLCGVARRHVLLSVPDMRYFITGSLTVFGTLPVFFRRMLSTSRWRNKNKTFGDDHYWEVGITVDGREYSEAAVREGLFGGRRLEADYRCFDVPWHHYYAVAAGDATHA